MSLSDRLVVGFVNFTRSFLGIIFRPYETVRLVIGRADFVETVYIWALLFAYFGLSSLVKTEAFRPLILTRKFMAMGFASVATYLISAYTVYQLALFFKGNGSSRGILVGWAYTLIPTVIWFLATSILFVVLPPPRTTSFLGVFYSLIYLIFSAVLFYWKVILCYLTIRFGMKLDLVRIAGVSAIFLPLAVLYSIFMYKQGFFRIPFI
jgi:hypothetical protein